MSFREQINLSKAYLEFNKVDVLTGPTDIQRIYLYSSVEQKYIHSYVVVLMVLLKKNKNAVKSVQAKKVIEKNWLYKTI